jgi:hypothetical protein
MKTVLKRILVLMALVGIAFAEEPDKRFVVVPLSEVLRDKPKEAPLFFSVTGEGLRDWSVRFGEGGARFLDVRPILQPGTDLTNFRVQVKTRLKIGRDAASLLLPGPGPATGFSLAVTAATDPGVELRVVKADGLMPVGDTKPRKFVGYGSAVLEIAAFPSSYVLPEVGVTEVTVYELAETDRRVSVDLELDIREAPLREWEMEISADHAVASVTGAQVADYAVAGEVKDGKRRLKIIFKQSVMNRQLVSVRLEKNEAAKAGPWNLQALGFPGAKSRRGYIGAVAAAGHRLVAGKTAGVAEVPVTFFPKKVAGLQQAFRLREGDWQVGLTIEALGQSVQADVFHLYSLKAGAAYGSVLINYFVVGAPASEWRISVPDGIGNIEVTGQNVGRDWRREGNTVIVPLSSPVLGTGTGLLTFEQPMSARGGELTPGDVRPLDVQAERGYVQVVSPLQVKFPKPVSEGPLLAIDVSELPAEFRLLSTAPTLAAWQYTARDFKIGMKVEWFNPGETVEQAIDFLELTSKISRDGEWITDAGFFVKSRGRSALRTILPVGAALWEAKVNGQTVNARADGDATLIPLPLKTDPNEAVEVSLRYGARGAKATVVRLGAPRLEAPVVIGEWKVTGDEGRQLVPRGGTAELVGSGLAENGWKWLARNPRPAGGLILLGIAAVFSGIWATPGVPRFLSLLLGFAFIMVAGGIGISAAVSGWRGSAVLEYAVPVMAAGSDVAVEIGNVAPWQARTGWGTWLVFALGSMIVLRGWFMRDHWWKSCGVALIGVSLLLIHGGAPIFFGVAALVALIWWLPRISQAIRDLRKPGIVEAAAALVILAGFSCDTARAENAPAAKPAESMIHKLANPRRAPARDAGRHAAGRCR